MSEHEHAGPGYASPQVAREQPPEKVIYVASLYEGTGIDKPDFIAVVDVERIIEREVGIALAALGDAPLTRAARDRLAELAAAKDLEIPLAQTFPLADVRAAYTQLAKGHVRGKIVLIP